MRRSVYLFPFLLVALLAAGCSDDDDSGSGVDAGADSSTTGSDTMGTDTTGSDTTGSDTTGSDTTGS
ncbi:MAG: hypothetical protein ACOCXM_10965, partial [Myxococcota bacterium]